jgi:hypothetical protein
MVSPSSMRQFDELLEIDNPTGEKYQDVGFGNHSSRFC